MRFEDLPIRRKLISITMAISGVVLILTCVSFIAYELITFRKAMKENLGTLAEVVARNSTAALAFQDREDAKDVLLALAAEPRILSAALYDLKGQLFATYLRTGHSEQFPRLPRSDGFSSDSMSFMVFRTVHAESALGRLYIRSDNKAFERRLQRYAVMVILILAISTSVAYLLSTALQKRISGPILELAGTARKVTEQKSYGVKARKYGADELGQLTDAFNEMLHQIHERDIALREKEERLRLALEASNTAVWDRNLLTGRSNWDQHMQELFGFKPGEFDGSEELAVSRIHPDDRLMVNERIAKALQNREEFTLELRALWPDQSIRHIVLRGKAYYDDLGVPAHITGVALDATENKKAEIALRDSEEKYRRLSAELDQRVTLRTSELEATNSELEAFTYSVSHDLRAPLRHMTAYSQLLLEDHGDKLDPEARRFLARIRLSARNMGQLVDDLLNLARIGRQELSQETVSLNTLVDQAMSVLRLETEKRNIEWKIAQLPNAKCDPGLVKQVFVNFISNSVKYTRPRELAVIEIGKLKRGDEVIIFVKDNGVGFNMEYSNKLFGVFQRLHRQEEFEGTGVGLATVARIVSKHHGRIWAEAEEHKGATFYFTFPGIQ